MSVFQKAAPSMRCHALAGSRGRLGRSIVVDRPDRVEPPPVVLGEVGDAFACLGFSRAAFIRALNLLLQI
jgi:hypothetical protein